MTLHTELELLAAPLLAGLLVVATHVPLGRRVLERGIIFIDITIAQVAALGVIIADVLGFHGAGGWRTQLAATLAALLAAALLTWTERHFRQLQEACIGSLYVLAASLAVLLLAQHPQGAEHMQDLLAGQILWLSLEQVWPVVVLYAGVLGVWFATRVRSDFAFYVLFALTVTASVQLVGIYLVFASLILPALATHGLPARQAVGGAWLLGAVGYGAGLWLSLLLDLPAGPLIVCTLAALAVFTAGLRGAQAAIQKR